MRTLSHETLSRRQKDRLELLVNSLNIIHPLKSMEGDSIRISAGDVYIYQHNSCAMDFEVNDFLLGLTVEVLEDSFVRALHIIYEQLMYTAGMRESVAEVKIGHIPPVVEAILDHAEAFKPIIQAWE